MRDGFLLFVDEAGDEGLKEVRPIFPSGSSEYFVLSGVLVRTSRYGELVQAFNLIKSKIGMHPADTVHFRDLQSSQQLMLITELAKLKLGLVVIVSNKQNMIRYRNTRCETKSFEIVRGQVRPKRYNWFYNNLFRYLLERASEECAKWTYKAYGEVRLLRVIFSHRKEFSYSQTRAYLYKLKIERRDSSYFNNKRQIDWSVLDIATLDSKKPRDEVGLQIADCVASAIYRSVDENWFGHVEPKFLEMLAPRFIKLENIVRDYGFKLLPDEFNLPLSHSQKAAFRHVGYNFR